MIRCDRHVWFYKSDERGQILNRLKFCHDLLIKPENYAVTKLSKVSINHAEFSFAFSSVDSPTLKLKHLQRLCVLANEALKSTVIRVSPAE